MGFINQRSHHWAPSNVGQHVAREQCHGPHEGRQERCTSRSNSPWRMGQREGANMGMMPLQIYDIVICITATYIYIYYYSYIIYLLVICQNSYWTWNLYSWFTYSRLWFSIAMLVYQTVIDMFLSWQMGQMDIDVLFRCFHVIFCMIIIPIKRNILKLYMDLTKENIENKNVPYRFPK